MPDKYAIFDRFASSLTRIDPTYGGQYGCPLTMSRFERTAIADETLTLEHCIPNGLGAKKYVLTAKAANNEAGAVVDAELHKMIYHDEFFREGIGTLTIRMNMGGHEVGAEFTRQVDGDVIKNQLKVIAERSNPQNLISSHEWAKSMTAKDEIPLNFHPNESPDKELARVAILKAGYLCLFHRLGYAYILDAVLNAVRQQILSPSEPILPLGKIVFEMKPEEYRDDVLMITEPERLMSFVIGLKLRKDAKATPRYFGVILPWSVKAYGNWAQATRQTLKMGVLHKGIDFIANPQPIIID
jgi:hypothetical protein